MRAVNTCICIVGGKHGNLNVIEMFETLGQIVASSIYDIIVNQTGLSINSNVKFIIVYLSYVRDRANEKENEKVLFLIIFYAIFFI